MRSDANTRRLLCILALLFAASVALRLNGSSVGVWKNVLGDKTSPSGLLLFKPKAVRSDEWMGWTPSILSQIHQRPAFPLENRNLGIGKTPLLMSVPVWHYSLLFRPQLWGFFLFSPEIAFAFYWNVKVFGLFIAFFFLFRLLLGDRFWLALFGAASVFFSAAIQWWFSCPPMLPEMLASWAAAILCITFLFRSPGGPRAGLLAVGALVISGVNFILFFYPPFQIPLLYLALAILAGCFLRDPPSRAQCRSGFFLLLIAAFAIAAVIIPYLLECRPTLQVLAQTAYPGRRFFRGGSLSLADLLNGLLGFFNSDEHIFPHGIYDNASEASNFYPLWLLALALWAPGLWRELRRGPDPGQTNRALEFSLLIYLIIFSLFVVSPLPEWFCRITLLSYVPEMRAQIGIGIANLLFATLLLARPPRSLERLPRLFLALLAVGGVAFLLHHFVTGNETIFTPGRVALLLAVNTLLIGAFCFAPRPFFLPFFLLSLVLNNGRINPVAAGLGPLSAASAAPLIGKIRDADPSARWIVYGSAWLPQFFKAQGVNVINGLNVVPDLSLARSLDPAGRYLPIYDRYAIIIMLPQNPGQPPVFQLIGVSSCILRVDPANPAFLRRGVRYAVFPDAGPIPDQSGLQLLAHPPDSQFAIYRLPAE